MNLTKKQIEVIIECLNKIRTEIDKTAKEI